MKCPFCQTSLELFKNYRYECYTINTDDGTHHFYYRSDSNFYFLNFNGIEVGVTSSGPYLHFTGTKVITIPMFELEDIKSVLDHYCKFKAFS